MKPPIAERRPTQHIVHGVSLSDDYAWLRDDNWQTVLRDPSVLSPDIRAHLDAENAYADAMLKPGEALREALFEELKGRLKPDDRSVPAPDGPYSYYSRFREGGQHRTYLGEPDRKLRSHRASCLGRLRRPDETLQGIAQSAWAHPNPKNLAAHAASTSAMKSATSVSTSTKR